MERHTVSKLIGSPPGYVGFNEVAKLTEAVRRRPLHRCALHESRRPTPMCSICCCSCLEDGRLTDSQRAGTGDFKNTLIIMTSNIRSK